MRLHVLALAGLGALCAFNGGARKALSEPADSRQLALTLGILPFFSALPEEPEAPAPDLDGYGAITPRKRSELGPSALVAHWLSATGEAAAIPVRKVEPGALALQAVFLAVEHREVSEPAPHWQANVELAVEVVDQRTGAALLHGTYGGTAPARGALPPGARRKLLENGVGNYLETPLGKAFTQAVDHALDGLELEAPGYPVDEADGVLPLLERLVWEARVTKTEGQAYWIDAGTANGLQVDDLMTPYAEEAPQDAAGEDADDRPAPSRRSVPGLLRVTRLEPHRALLAAVAGEEVPAGVEVSLVHFGRSGDAYSKAFIDIDGVPGPFRGCLQHKLNNMEATSGGKWPTNSIGVIGTGRQVGGKYVVSLEFHDNRKPGRPVFKTWRGPLTDADASLVASRCVDALRPTLIAQADIPAARRPRPMARVRPHPLPTPSLPMLPRPMVVVRPPTVRPVPVPVSHDMVTGRLPQQFPNRRSMDVSLAFSAKTPPKPGILFYLGDDVIVELQSNADGWGLVYSLDSTLELKQVWPARADGDKIIPFPPAKVSRELTKR
ncbi:MAG: hypothetical protein K0Q72_3112, partial [Armatimonadetes bacterium]|nr:hypothetical protein [Armatimonadota bacterium]